MKKQRLLLWTLSVLLTTHLASAQNAFYNATIPPGSSDNTGGSTQNGTEVLHSTFGAGIVFDPASSFEHVGQLYIAQDGLWNQNSVQLGNQAGTDYFGYAPGGLGASRPYLGRGIKGASPNNGGSGAGQPTFGHLQLNSTGEFPVVAGMYITHSLAFNANGPGESSIITTPNCIKPESYQNAVIFGSAASIQGANSSSYINGFASVQDVTGPFTLPVGEPTDADSPFHPLTINRAVSGRVTVRYSHDNPYSTTALGQGVGWVSSIGSWPISAPAGTEVTVSLPMLGLSLEEAAKLRLVGWNGSQWISLSNVSTSGACTTGDCQLKGTLAGNVSVLAIGLTERPRSEPKAGELALWPNPTRSQLNYSLPTSATTSEVRIANLNSQTLIRLGSTQHIVNVSALPTGSYILEVLTAQGQTLRKRFIKQ